MLLIGNLNTRPQPTRVFKMNKEEDLGYRFIGSISCYGITTEIFMVKPGCEIPRHRHPINTGDEVAKVETYMWLAGEGRLTITEESSTEGPVITEYDWPSSLAQKMGYTIPAGAIHMVKNTGSTPLLFLTTYHKPDGVEFRTEFVEAWSFNPFRLDQFYTGRAVDF